VLSGPLKEQTRNKWVGRAKSEGEGFFYQFAEVDRGTLSRETLRSDRQSTEVESKNHYLDTVGSKKVAYRVAGFMNEP